MQPERDTVPADKPEIGHEFLVHCACTESFVSEGRFRDHGSNVGASLARLVRVVAHAIAETFSTFTRVLMGELEKIRCGGDQLGVGDCFAKVW